MPAHIAIPEPTSTDTAYNQRALAHYLSSLHSAGAIPVVVPLHERPDRVARLLAGVQGVLLPGSPHDIDPQRFGEDRVPECADDDPARTAVDELLLQDAFNLHKPILGVCFGIQNLNVWCNGSLVQHLTTPVDHSPDDDAMEVHPIRIEAGSRLAGLLPPGHSLEEMVNSSHHQAVKRPGDHLAVTAFSPTDGVIEAVELDAPEHFVVGVQWHPERTYTHSALSRALFGAFVRAAEGWTPRRIKESVAMQSEA
jgi:putative glutamine amidotransferase